jgi:hypothetical protein
MTVSWGVGNACLLTHVLDIPYHMSTGSRRAWLVMVQVEITQHSM